MLSTARNKGIDLKAFFSVLNIKNMNKKVKAILLLLVFSLPSLLFAQTPPNFDEQVYDVAVPFDDGVSLLVIAAIGYGLFRVWQYKKAEKRKKVLLSN
jgi:hypothetical protein